MSRLEGIFVHVLDRCADLKAEDVLIVSDPKYDQTIVDALTSALRRFDARPILLTTDAGLLTDRSVPRSLTAAMRNADLILLCTSFLVSQGVRREATQAGARLISMSGIDRETVKRCFDVNYDELSKTTRVLSETLQSSRTITYKTDSGTELRVELAGRKSFYLDGLARARGQLSALPAGVVAVAPREETADGTIVIDGSVAEIGVVHSPISCIVEDGRIADIKGGREAKKFKALLSIDSSAGFCLAEVGVGTNPKAKYTGNLLEDERVYASGHIGFGRNSHIGGIIESKVHIDSTVRRPEVHVNGQRIISSGRIVTI